MVVYGKLVAGVNPSEKYACESPKHPKCWRTKMSINPPVDNGWLIIDNG